MHHHPGYPAGVLLQALLFHLCRKSDEAGLSTLLLLHSDIFLIPGGTGVKSFLHMEGENGQQLLKQAVEEASFCMMVQNASALLARTGLLFHRQVADYAYDENWKRMFTVGIDYIDGEKWISDGKYYSCSTTVAAMDMTLALISDNLDVSVAEKIAEEIGYSWDSSF